MQSKQCLPYSKVASMTFISSPPLLGAIQPHGQIKWNGYRYLDKYYCKRLILSHHKNLLRGDYIIDDRGKHGTSGFKGEWLCFGSEEFPDWDSVLKYLQVSQ